MTFKSTQSQAPMFYQKRTQPASLLGKTQQWLYRQQLKSVQMRIAAIQEALQYELKQNYPHHKQQQLIATAQNMHWTLSHKQQRLLRKLA